MRTDVGIAYKLVPKSDLEEKREIRGKHLSNSDCHYILRSLWGVRGERWGRGEVDSGLFFHTISLLLSGGRGRRRVGVGGSAGGGSVGVGGGGQVRVWRYGRRGGGEGRECVGEGCRRSEGVNKKLRQQ